MIAKGDLEEVNNLKKQEGKDIIVYGGSNFVSNLIKHNLIDEYYIFINPTALGTGKGLPMFADRKQLSLVKGEPVCIRYRGAAVQGETRVMTIAYELQ